MTNAPDAVLALDDLTRYYGAVVGVEGLNLTLAPGEILGLVGLNGAGKSTTLRLVLGLLRASRGGAKLFGVPARRAVNERRKIGYLPSQLAFYPEWTAHQNLEHLARLDAGDLTTRRQRRSELGARLELSSSDLKRPITDMSHGMRQKVGLLQALEHDPLLVILDEPSDGLDPIARHTLAQLLIELRERGGTALVASHVLTELEAVADRIGVLHRGRLVALETAEALKSREAVTVRVSFTGLMPHDLEQLEHVSVSARYEKSLELKARPPLDPLIKALARYQVDALEVSEPKLEDLVIRIARDNA